MMLGGDDKILDALSVSLDTFGRGGGGGSGGGGSGGGGSGGVGTLLIYVLGYLPMHFIGALLRKKTTPLIANILGWMITCVYAFILVLPGVYGWFVAIAAIVGMGAGLYNWFDKVAKLAGIAAKKQRLAFQKDGAWDKPKLEAIVRGVFDRYQSDWSNNDSKSMEAYLTPAYLYHNQLMIAALKQLKRRNDVISPLIKDLQLVKVADSDDNTKDRFVMYIKAKAHDTLYDINTNEKLFLDSKPFEEYWRFVRSDGENWRLDGIGQATDNPYMHNNVFATFAREHNYCYSPDWGWLLLPKRGQLFKGGKFGISDINNHVIGMYNNILIQIYNYNPAPNQYIDSNYLIAQVALPKTYGNIVVRKKQRFSFVGTKGLTRVKMEWGEFNQRYEVWASDMERVTSFELLNPSFMVKLQELPFEVNIEVVDNIVYLYSFFNRRLEARNYEVMLSLLHQAFKEI
jgi:hypothetical protein